LAQLNRSAIFIEILRKIERFHSNLKHSISCLILDAILIDVSKSGMTFLLL